MTVLENVMVGRHCRAKNIFLKPFIKRAASKREEHDTIEFSRNLLKIFGLTDFADHPAENLPYAFQRRLEIARALATEPFLLLLDEPAAGMNPQETQDLEQLILQIRKENKISILLIEHDMKLVMSLSEKIYVGHFIEPYRGFQLNSFNIRSIELANEFFNGVCPVIEYIFSFFHVVPGIGINMGNHAINLVNDGNFGGMVL